MCQTHYSTSFQQKSIFSASLRKHFLHKHNSNMTKLTIDKRTYWYCSTSLTGDYLALSLNLTGQHIFCSSTVLSSQTRVTPTTLQHTTLLQHQPSMFSTRRTTDHYHRTMLDTAAAQSHTHYTHADNAHPLLTMFRRSISTRISRTNSLNMSM